MQAEMRQEQNFSPLLKRKLYWGRKLRRSLTNPFPLAPWELLKKGKITETNHIEQRWGFCKFIGSIMRAKKAQLVDALDFLAIPHDQVETLILGAGTTEDLIRWIFEFEKEKIPLVVREFAEFACDNAKKLGISSLTVIEGEVVEEWGGDELHSKTLMTFASQFVMILKPRTMRRLMYLLGRSMRLSQGLGVLPELCLVHPLPEHNDQPVEWEGLTLVPSRFKSGSKRRHWGRDTTLYPIAELKAALEKGYGGEINIEIVATHMYYIQKYAFLSCTPKMI